MVLLMQLDIDVKFEHSTSAYYERCQVLYPFNISSLCTTFEFFACNSVRSLSEACRATFQPLGPSRLRKAVWESLACVGSTFVSHDRAWFAATLVGRSSSLESACARKSPNPANMATNGNGNGAPSSETVTKNKIREYLDITLPECCLPELGEQKTGKVRDIYFAGENVVMVTNDRVSAFDFILPNLIPFKGQVLNNISEFTMAQTADVLPNALVKNMDGGV
eukprot:5055103-Amphidinium_carterae.2